MFNIFGDRVMRCSNNHLFVATQGSRLFSSIHLGPFRVMQCPLDGKVGMCGNVDANSLSPQQLEEASHYRA
ncbi:hypothetical protein GCM10011575_25310 [Microlunatus endophyticus]|uniref:Uncharacterized protein n=1 Tax=Microlunatus endophyticus TaxID=1716077 RepID=A0A917S9I6_9ACTN|nr:hypothetical protein [Microlunatus endophyticus]GGL65828.1 hypothetical protein GCM10011575_25310 [Microlunatus endophyticus]